MIKPLKIIVVKELILNFFFECTRAVCVRGENL